VLAYAIMLAAWPWAALEPLNPLRAVSAFADFHYRIRTVLDGQVYYMADVPRWYVPTYVVIKLTLLLLVGAALALGLMLLPRRAAVSGCHASSRETALIAFAAFFPLACEVVTGGPAFTGMRHFLFIIPPMAVLAGLGVDGALSRLRARSSFFAAAAATLVFLDLGVSAVTLYRLHPHEYLFYNPLIGGLAGAADRFATDYWVNIMPEAVGDLERFLDRTDVASNANRSRRRYLVAVCGERLPFEKAADTRLQWTRDVGRAEFCADAHALRPRPRRTGGRHHQAARRRHRRGQGPPRHCRRRGPRELTFGARAPAAKSVVSKGYFHYRPCAIRIDILKLELCGQ
jgi:hypothetical protein